MRISEAYETLGVTQRATMEQIRDAYRARAMATHPDRGGAQESFITVRAAYEILCEFHGRTVDDTGMPLPEELQKLVDEIVQSFRVQFENAEATCASEFQRFHKRMRAHISNASTKELREFSETFQEAWNLFVRDLFWQFNKGCAQTITKYEQWFYETSEETFRDLHRRELRSFARRPRFYAYFVVLGILSVATYYAVPRLGNTGFGAIGPWVSLIPMGLLPVVYWMSCCSRRKSASNLSRMDVQLFQLEDGVEFAGSAALKRGNAKTKGLAVGGFVLADALSWGIGASVAGGVIGLVLGGLIDELRNPTEKIRASIQRQYDQFSEAAEPEVTRYVVDAHRELLDELRDKIIENYNRKMKETVLLLAAS